MKLILILTCLLPAYTLAFESPALLKERNQWRQVFFLSHKDACERRDAMVKWLDTYKQKFTNTEIQEAATLLQNEFFQARDERDALQLECWSDGLQKLKQIVGEMDNKKERKLMLNDLETMLFEEAHDLLFY